ncbi:MAG TPA: Rrf2 family transcriptional regulator [Bacteroidales bacterium]|jgi:Rrf2 family protein|nr:Rrf2 family transcriptional regulator [Bacteroidales bacterium]
MLSNSCKYGIRAMIYLAKHHSEKASIGIKEISHDLDLPTPFLAKIMQQLARHKVLNSVKGPNGGFSLVKKPESLTLYDIVKIIDGEDLFKNCIIHEGTCKSVKKGRKECAVHDDFENIRKDLLKLFRTKTLAELAESATDSKKVLL